MPRNKPPVSNVRPIYAVFGSEAFLRRQHAGEIVQRVLGPASQPLCLSEYEGGAAELAAVLDDLRTLPFLSDRRLVVVRDADSFLAVEAHRDALMRYLESPSPTGVLLLVGERLDSRLKLTKTIAAVGEVCKCEKDRGFRIIAWVGERAAARGKRLDAEAAAALVELVGTDLARLDNEIEKLSLYAGAAPAITPDHVLDLVGLQREEKVFAITDAIADGEAGRAMQAWEQTLATDRAAPARAIGGLAWGFRRLIEAKEMTLRGVPIDAAARKFWTDPQRLRSRLDRWSLEGLRRGLDALLEADLAIKTGLTTATRAVEKFIVSQCHRQRERRLANVS